MRFDEETTPLQWGLAIALSLGAAAAITSLFGYPVGGSTVGLAAVFVATLSLLRAMARLVTSMNQQEVGLEFVSDDGRSARAWREEKKRSLRAIQELKLDYALQKIGDKDYQAILSQYEARALAAIHALDAKTALHPDLVRDLERYGDGASSVQDAAQGEKAQKGDECPEEQGARKNEDFVKGQEASKAEGGANAADSSSEEEPLAHEGCAKGEPSQPVQKPSSVGDAGQNAPHEQVEAGSEKSPRVGVRICKSCNYEESDATARFCKTCGQEFGA